MKVIRTDYHPEPTYETRHGLYIEYSGDNDTQINEAIEWGLETLGYLPPHGRIWNFGRSDTGYFWFKTEEDQMLFLLRWA